MPASPASSTTCPSPSRARAQRESSSASCFLRSTRGVMPAARSASKAALGPALAHHPPGRDRTGEAFEGVAAEILGARTGRPGAAACSRRRPPRRARPAPAAERQGWASRRPRPPPAPRPARRDGRRRRGRWRSRSGPRAPRARSARSRPHRRRGRETGPDGPLGGILVRPRPAKEGEHAVAHELGDVPAEAGDLGGDRVLVGREDLAHLLGVEPRRERRRADQVGEHHGQLPALGLVTRAGQRLLRLDPAAERDLLLGGAPPDRAAMASSSLRRWPTEPTPSAAKSSAVSLSRISPSMSLARKARSYCSRPRPRSQARCPRASPVGPRSHCRVGLTRHFPAVTIRSLPYGLGLVREISHAAGRPLSRSPSSSVGQAVVGIFQAATVAGSANLSLPVLVACSNRPCRYRNDQRQPRDLQGHDRCLDRPARNSPSPGVCSSYYAGPPVAIQPIDRRKTIELPERFALAVTEFLYFNHDGSKLLRWRTGLPSARRACGTPRPCAPRLAACP